MDKLKIRSLDGVEQNIEMSGKLFPNVITEVMRNSKEEHAANFEQIFQTYSLDKARKVL